LTGKKEHSVSSIVSGGKIMKVPKDNKKRLKITVR